MDTPQKPELPKNLALVFRRIGEQLEAYYSGSVQGAVNRAELESKKPGVRRPVILYRDRPQASARRR